MMNPPALPTKRVLFLCTGNYYRSRFAECIFIILARKRRLPWTADSRGLRLEDGVHNIGPISPLVLAALSEYSGSPPWPIRHPMPACAADFQAANIVIGMDESEHRRMMAERFPQFAHQVEYWHIHDLDRCGPEAALAQVETQVLALINRLAG